MERHWLSAKCRSLEKPRGDNEMSVERVVKIHMVAYLWQPPVGLAMAYWRNDDEL